MDTEVRMAPHQAFLTHAAPIDVLLRDLQVLDARLRGGVAGHVLLHRSGATNVCTGPDTVDTPQGDATAPSECRWDDSSEAKPRKTTEASATAGVWVRLGLRVRGGSEYMRTWHALASERKGSRRRRLAHVTGDGEMPLMATNWKHGHVLSRAGRCLTRAHNPGLLGSTPRPATSRRSELASPATRRARWRSPGTPLQIPGTFAAAAWTVTRRMFVHLAGADHELKQLNQPSRCDSGPQIAESAAVNKEASCR